MLHSSISTWFVSCYSVLCIRLLAALSFFLSFLLSPILFGQNVGPSLADLENLWKNRCTEEYFVDLKKIEKGINHSDTSLWLDQLDSLKWWYRRAEQLQHPKDRKLLRMAYQGLASDYKKAQDLYSAFEIYERAHWLLEDPKQLDDYGWYIENPLLTIATRLDNFAKAEYYGWKVVQYLIVCQEEEKLSRVYHGLGKLYRTKLDWHQSDSIYLLGIENSRKIKYNYGELINTFDLADNKLMQDSIQEYQKYITQVEYLIPKITAEKSYALYLVELSRLKADYHFKTMQYQNAFSFYNDAIQKILQIPTAETREKSKLYCKIGICALQAFGFDSANHFYQYGIELLLPEMKHNYEIPGKNFLHRENTLIELFDLKSQIEYHRFQKSNNIHDLKRAIQYVLLICHLSKSTIEDILGEESKILSLKQLRQYIERTFDWCAEFQEYQNDLELMGYLRELLDYSKSQLIHDRWNTKARFEALSENERTEVEKTIGQIRRLEEGTTNEDKFARITELRLKIEKILNRKFNDLLLKDTAKNYLEFFFSQNFVYRYCELNEFKSLVVLGTKEKLDSLYQSMNLVISQKDNQATMVWKELYQFLWSGIPANVPKKIAIVPDELLHNLPFEALAGNDQKLLIEMHQISYRFSRIYPKVKNKRKIKSNEILILAPQYPENPISSVERGSIYHLKYAQEESEEIHKELDVHQDGSEPKTKDQLIPALKKCRIFHFAGHGVMNPYDAYLALEKDQLSYEDITMMYHNTDLSVLSACETGLGKWIAGDANRSLAKAFTESGTSTVVHSLWTVNDKSTSQIMTDFYKNLKAGQTVGSALSNAKLHYLQNESFEWRHPHYWAGFVVTGGPELVLSLGNAHVTWFTLVIGVTLFLISAFFIKRYKTKIKIN